MVLDKKTKFKIQHNYKNVIDIDFFKDEQPQSGVDESESQLNIDKSKFENTIINSLRKNDEEGKESEE